MKMKKQLDIKKLLLLNMPYMVCQWLQSGYWARYRT